MRAPDVINLGDITGSRMQGMVFVIPAPEALKVSDMVKENTLGNKWIASIPTPVYPRPELRSNFMYRVAS